MAKLSVRTERVESLWARAFLGRLVIGKVIVVFGAIVSLAVAFMILERGGASGEAAGPVVVHTLTQIGIVHRDVLGVNNSNGDNSAQQLEALATPYAAMGIKAGRYSGNSSVFDWRDSAPNTMALFCNSTTRPLQRSGDFDAYMRLALQDGISPEITTDYDTSGWPRCTKPGLPALAASWVEYSNVTRKYGVKWWEIGNEEYIPGHLDQHTVANGFPNGPNNRYTYGATEPLFYRAMKQVDPTINIGIPVTGPTAYYGGWDAWLLGHANYDYVAYHYYPLRYPNATDYAALHVATSDPNNPSSPSVPATIRGIRSELVAANRCQQPCNNFPISISEWNTVPVKPGPQSFSIVQALFAAQVLGEFFDASVTRAEYWNSNGCEQDGIAGQPHTYGWQNVGTAGLLSYVTPDAFLCPYADFTTPFGTILPSGRAFELYAQSGFATEGAAALAVDQPDPNLRTYAANTPNSLVVVAVNLNGTDYVNTTLAFDGISGGTGYRTIQYSKAIYDLSKDNGPFDGPESANHQAWKSPLSLSLPPWSITTFTFSKSSLKT
jgi:hypothetical protein